MIATGVVRGRPLFRPRIVMSPLKPSGTPARQQDLGDRAEERDRPGARGSAPWRFERSSAYSLCA